MPAESTEVLLAPQAPAPQPSPQPTIAVDHALKDAVSATLRAEHLRRRRAQRPSVETIIDRIPDLSDHKRAFLKANPQFVVDREKQQLMRAAYAEALQAGIADDTPEMNRAVIMGRARPRSGEAADTSCGPRRC